MNSRDIITFFKSKTGQITAFGLLFFVGACLLQASKDPNPKAGKPSKQGDNESSGWGWPAPRVDSASSLPFLAFRLGICDKRITSALRSLAKDKSSSVRFNLARHLATLETIAPNLMWELIKGFVGKERFFTILAAIARSLDWLWAGYNAQVLGQLALITKRAQKAPEDHEIHEVLAQIYFFQSLRTGERGCETYVSDLIENCDTPRANKGLLPVLHACREGGWMTPYAKGISDQDATLLRQRSWDFLNRLLSSAQGKLRLVSDELTMLSKESEKNEPKLKVAREKRDRIFQLIDAIAAQLYFACGAFTADSSPDKILLTPVQLGTYWKDAQPLLSSLSNEKHPHTLDQIIQTLHHLVACEPAKIFMLVVQSVLNGRDAGIQFESIVVDHVVAFVRQALADHGDIFQDNSAGVLLNAYWACLTSWTYS